MEDRVVARPVGTRWGLVRVVLGLVLSVASTGLSLELARTPALAAGCYQHACTGTDPYQTGCDVSPGPYEAGFELLGHSTSIALRWSTVCGTVWARYISDAQSCCVEFPVTVEHQIYNAVRGWIADSWDTAESYVLYVNSGHVGRFWTQQIAIYHSGSRYRACWSTLCTDWWYV